MAVASSGFFRRTLFTVASTLALAAAEPVFAEGPADWVRQGREAQTQQNFAEAARLYKRAAGKGDREAQHLLGHLYEKGAGVPQDAKEAFRLFKLAADQGERDSQYHVGVAYFRGDGTEADADRAVVYLKRSAAQGYKPAQQGLATIALQWPSPKHGDSLKQYALAAPELLPNGHFLLGGGYMNGYAGLPVDFAKAAEHFRAALKTDDSTAVKKQLKIAETYVEAQRLADQPGNLEYTLGLATVYGEGQGTRRNDKEALRLYRFAAEQGSVVGMVLAAEMLHAGEGAKKDERAARKLLDQAALITAQQAEDAGDTEAAAELRRIPGMTDPWKEDSSYYIVWVLDNLEAAAARAEEEPLSEEFIDAMGEAMGDDE